MNTKPVSSLPDLVQSQFPTLPELPVDAALLIPFGSKFGNYEKEVVLGVVATVAAHNKSWKPVAAREFLAVAEKGVPPMLFQGVINAIWQLAEEGYIEMVRCDEVDHIVPTPDFAAVLGKCNLRYLPAAP